MANVYIAINVYGIGDRMNCMFCGKKDYPLRDVGKKKVCLNCAEALGRTIKDGDNYWEAMSE